MSLILPLDSSFEWKYNFTLEIVPLCFCFVVAQSFKDYLYPWWSQISQHGRCIGLPPLFPAKFIVLGTE